MDYVWIAIVPIATALIGFRQEVCTCTLKLSGLISKREGLAYKTLISEYKVHVVSMKRTHTAADICTNHSYMLVLVSI